MDLRTGATTLNTFREEIDMNYTFRTFHGGKSHFLPDILREEIEQDMLARGCTLDEGHTKEGVEVSFDFGGGAFIGMPIIKGVTPSGVRVEFSADQADICLMSLSAALRGSPRKSASGAEYFKIHGGWHCYVFTPEVLREVREVVKGLLPEADRQYAVFCAERRVRGLPGNLAELQDHMAEMKMALPRQGAAG